MPLLAPLLIPFFTFAAAIVIIGWARTHAATQGTQDTPSFWDVITGRVLLKQIFGAASKAASFIASHFAAAQLRHLAKWFLGMGTLSIGWFRVSAEFAETVDHALHWMVHRGDPKARTEAKRAGAHAAAAGRAAHRANVHAGRVGHALDTYKTRTAPRIAHATHAVDVTIPRDIAGLRARNKALERGQTRDRGAIGELEHGAIKTWDWIRSHPLSAATGIFAGAVAVALSRLGYGFLRCRSWRRLGRSLTCNDANILADLLAAATLVVGAMSLVELAREEQKVVGEAAKLVRGFWEL